MAPDVLPGSPDFVPGVDFPFEPPYLVEQIRRNRQRGGGSPRGTETDPVLIPVGLLSRGPSWADWVLDVVNVCRANEIIYAFVLMDGSRRLGGSPSAPSGEAEKQEPTR